MNALKRTVLPILVCLAALPAFAQAGPDTGGHGPSQAAADALRAYAGADGAFLVAGIIRPSAAREDLATLLQYPTDGLVVLGLTGAQIRQAFERSVSLYPLANSSFLQISGFEVTFNPAAAPNRRVTSILAGGSRLDDTRTYNVAMPSTLARGAMGYFKIWEKAKVVRDYPNVTVESILKDKAASDLPSRWTARP